MNRYSGLDRLVKEELRGGDEVPYGTFLCFREVPFYAMNEGIEFARDIIECQRKTESY
jgi:hypothetical protein